MHTLLTALSFACLVGCFLAFLRSLKAVDNATATVRTSESIAMKLRAERDRVTVMEREVEALRRELRKLSGKFYALMRQVEEGNDDQLFEEEPGLGYGPVSDPRQAPLPLGAATAVCENWALAKRDGPLSPAAKCECAYCVNARLQREQFRSQVVPKTVRAQGELAKVNSGTP